MSSQPTHVQTVVAQGRSDAQNNQEELPVLRLTGGGAPPSSSSSSTASTVARTRSAGRGRPRVDLQTPSSSTTLTTDASPMNLITANPNPVSELLANVEPTIASRRSLVPDRVEAVELPSKMQPDDGDRIEPASFFNVMSNMFVLDMTNAVDEVYKYELAVRAFNNEKNTEKDLTRGLANDHFVTIRRKLLWDLWNFFIEKCKLAKYNDVFYDRRTIAYAKHPLFDHSSAQFFSRAFEIAELPTAIRDSLPSARFHRVEIECKFVEIIRLHDCVMENAGLEARNRPLIQFLEIVTSQHLHLGESHVVFNNKAYVADGELLAGGGKRLHHGFVKNVRPVGDCLDDARLVVQIDSTRAPFFRSIELLEFVCRHLHLQNASELYRCICRGGEGRKTVFKQLKDLAVTTSYGEKHRTFLVASLSEHSANEQKFVGPDGKSTTVAAYFERAYGLQLMYPQLPCVVDRNGGRESFYPMELLMIAQFQRADDKLTPEETSEIIRASAVMPPARQQLIREHLIAAKLTNDNPFLAALAIRVSETPLNAQGFQLHAPAIVYGNNQVTPNNGAWQIGRNHFHRPANSPMKWAVVVFDKNDRALRANSNEFVGKLLHCARSHGLNLSLPECRDCLATIEAAQTMMRMYAHSGCRFVFFITREQKDPIHETMKLFEQEYALLTQHVCKKTVDKAVSPRGGAMVLDNIVMKMNLKLGGLCHVLATSNALIRANPRLPCDVVNQWLAGDRMFVGLDVSHPPPQKPHERRLQVPQDPSVVGLCYSNGSDALDLRGTYWYQESRREKVVDHLDEHFTQALHQFKANRGILPKHIIFYRDGVSEGQYRMVIDEEVPQIRAACVDAAANCPSPYRPHLTLMVVQKRGNQRVMPATFAQSNRAPDLNVPPGTCVEARIVHPVYQEFIIVSHKAIQGTACPLRCTLLVDDEPRMSLDELEGLTNALAYGHGIVNGAVSMPAPVYGAHELAKRGANNYRENRRMEMGSTTSTRSASSSTPDLQAMTKGMRELDFTTKFWA